MTVTQAAPDPPSRRFLIAGCQRSGTTMMRLILESHKDIACFDEQYSYEILSGRSPQPASTGPGVIGFKIPVWSEQLLAPVLHWNEYSYLYGTEPVPNFYRRESLIFMVRSPFDSVSSMMRLPVENDSWLQRVAIPVVHAMAEAGRLAPELCADLDFAMSSQDPEVALGALYWKIKSGAALAYTRANLPIHLVIYEQFVASPATYLPSILRRLGLEWDDSVLLHHQKGHGEIINGKAIGDTDPARPIDTRSIGHAGSRLSASQIGLIERITGGLDQTLRSLSPQH